MCLILVAHRAHPRFPLVVAANRDEFHARPSASSHYWQAPDGMLAGRDLEAGGTWLGVSRAGGFAAITNVSEYHEQGDWLSRGDLVRQFLGGAAPATSFADTIEPERYRGFNLLLWDGKALSYSSNRGGRETLGPGFHGLANAGLDEDRFKVARGTRGLEEAIHSTGEDSSLIDALFCVLSDRTTPPAPEPRRVPGMSEAQRRALGACFITGGEYGTRASSVVLLGAEHWLFAERVYAPYGALVGESLHTLPLRDNDADVLDSPRTPDAD